MADSRIVVHLSPARREQADFIIAAPLEDCGFEQLWARRVGENSFELCCIPFFLYGSAMGDVVETENTPDKPYVMTRTVVTGGNGVVRIWFGEEPEPDVKRQVIQSMSDFSCEIEWYSGNLLAVSCPSALMPDVVATLEANPAWGRLHHEIAA